MVKDKLPPDRGPPNGGPPNDLVDLCGDDVDMDIAGCTTEGEIVNEQRQVMNVSSIISNNPPNKNASAGDLTGMNCSVDDELISGNSNIVIVNNKAVSSNISGVINRVDTQKTDISTDKNLLSEEGKKIQERYDELAKNKYRITDAAPYYVFVEHAGKNIGRLFPIRVGHFLYQDTEFRKGIKDIVSVGINRVKIVANTYSVANKLVDHPTLLKNGLRSYIPSYFTQKKGSLSWSIQCSTSITFGKIFNPNKKL